MFLKGPSKYKKKENTYIPIPSPEIMDAYMEWNSNVYPLLENEVSITWNLKGWNIYHSFRYENYSGRWYKFGEKDLKVQANNSLEFKTPYEMDGHTSTATIKIFLSPTANLGRKE